MATAHPDPFRGITGLIPNTRFSLITGGAAGNHTVTGITTDDRLIAVLSTAGSNAQVTGTNTAIVTGFAANKSTVSAGEDTANTKSIATGLTAPDMFHMRVLRTNVDVTGDAVQTVSGGDLVIADGATYVLTEGDVVHWIAYDASDAVLTAVFTGSTPTGSIAASNLTAEFTISAANTINNTSGTATVGDTILVIWEDHDFGQTSNPAWTA